jgi:ribosomal protein S18 acetylase RimI-like enzyme
MRACRPEDLETVADIANRAWRGIYANYRQILGDEIFLLIRPQPETGKGNEVRASFERQPEWFWVCEEEGRIIGFITCSMDSEKHLGTIGNNAVDPSCPLKGIGQQMYAFVLEQFRRNGMRYATVTTGLDEPHARARRAYERAGFSRRIEMTHYYMTLSERESHD